MKRIIILLYEKNNNSFVKVIILYILLSKNFEQNQTSTKHTFNSKYYYE